MNTTQNLPDILRARNHRGRYCQLIDKARSGGYHDTMSTSLVPKADLETDLARFPELRDLLSDVKEGRFNERDCSALFASAYVLLHHPAYAYHEPH